MGSGYKVEVPDVDYFESQVACRVACPVATDAGGYVQAVAGGDCEHAYTLARKPNPFASVCGRICAAPCEAACRRGALDAPVAIRALKRVVCERFGVESNSFDIGRVYAGERKGAASGRRVAVVGGGPAGLACAHDLALDGFSVTVFEAHSSAGGMLVLGVPEYRLPREVVQAEIRVIESLGVDIRLNAKLGRDFDLASLKDQGYEATFLAIGAHKSREIAIEGMGLDGVLRAVDFLLNIHLGYRLELGKKVVVIGGGNVAFDVARSVLRQADRMASMSEAELRGALRQASQALDNLTGQTREPTSDVRSALDVAREAIRRGVPDVHMYCLEDQSEIPAAQEEIEEARREGIQVHTRWGPGRILGEGSRVSGIELVRCRKVFDDTGRFDPVFDRCETRKEDCETVVLAIGQSPDLSWLRSEDGLKISSRDTIEADPETLATARPDVFAGGDAAFGPRIVITAVAEGRRAARSIAGFLMKGHTRPGSGNMPGQGMSQSSQAKVPRLARSTLFPGHQMPFGYEKRRRCTPPTLSVDRRVGVAEVEQAYGVEEAVEEAERCLKCHLSPVFDGDKCILCGGCADVCPEGCLRLVDVADLNGGEPLGAAIQARYGTMPVRGEQGAIIKDETRCIRCGLCVKRCPAGAITMERVEWISELRT